MSGQCHQAQGRAARARGRCRNETAVRVPTPRERAMEAGRADRGRGADGRRYRYPHSGPPNLRPGPEPTTSGHGAGHWAPRPTMRNHTLARLAHTPTLLRVREKGGRREYPMGTCPQIARSRTCPAPHGGRAKAGQSGASGVPTRARTVFPIDAQAPPLPRRRLPHARGRRGAVRGRGVGYATVPARVPGPTQGPQTCAQRPLADNLHQRSLHGVKEHVQLALVHRT